MSKKAGRKYLSFLLLTLYILVMIAPGIALASDEEPGELSFAAAYTYSAVSDGVDFYALIDKTAYMGLYKHVSEMTAKFTRETASSWTQPPVAYEDAVQPILWRVMGEEGRDGALTLLSEYVIDSRQFHNNDVWLNFDYPKSSIRAWLNGSFLNNAFTSAESSSLKVTDVVQKMWNPKTNDWVLGSFTTLWGSSPDHTTDFPKTAYEDKVYLPWREYNSSQFHWDAANKSVDEYLVTGDAAIVQLRNGKTQADTEDWIWALSRSPMPESSNHILPGNYCVSSFGIRPIIKLNPANVIYAAKQGKSYQLTLLNESLSLNNGAVIAPEIAENTATGGKEIVIRSPASGHDVLAYKIVSDSSEIREIVAYGTGGKNELRIDTSKLQSGEYSVYIWAQKEGRAGFEGSLPMYTTLYISGTEVSVNSPMLLAGTNQTTVKPETPVITVENSLSNFTAVREYASGTFTDIQGLWGESFIKDAYTYGIIGGIGSNAYDPHGALTGAQAVTIAARIHAIYKYGAKAAAPKIEEYKVNDNPAKSNWWDEFVAYLKTEGLFDAQLSGKINNTVFLTRAEMVHVWANLLLEKDLAAQNSVVVLPDVTASTPYYEDIIKFYEAGITGGRDAAGTFAPDDKITRMECATIFMRLIDASIRISGATYGSQPGAMAPLSNTAGPALTNAGGTQYNTTPPHQSNVLLIVGIVSVSVVFIAAGIVFLLLRLRNKRAADKPQNLELRT